MGFVSLITNPCTLKDGPPMHVHQKCCYRFQHTRFSHVECLNFFPLQVVGKQQAANTFALTRPKFIDWEKVFCLTWFQNSFLFTFFSISYGCYNLSILLLYMINWMTVVSYLMYPNKPEIDIVVNRHVSWLKSVIDQLGVFRRLLHTGNSS